MNSLRGDPESVGELFAASIALYEQVDDRQGQARAFVNGQVAVPGGGQVKVPTPRVD